MKPGEEIQPNFIGGVVADNLTPVAYHTHDEINSPAVAAALGTPASPSYRSLDFEADDSEYLLITDAAQTGLQLATTFSIEAWVKVESLTTARCIVSKSMDTTGVSYVFDIGTDGKLNLQVSDDGSFSAGHFILYTTTYSQINLNVWTHVGVTFDISGPTAIFYVDNSAVSCGDSGGTVAGSLYDNDRPFCIGAVSNTPTTSFFDGFIDDVRVWNVVRTQAEMVGNYLNEIDPTSSGLVGYWKLNNNLVDATTNGNNLTKAGTPTFSTDWHGA